MAEPWTQIETEATFETFPLPAYSEFMPPPYVGIKPYAPTRAKAAATFAARDANTFDIDEYEQAHDLEPGLDHIARHLLDELAKLIAGKPHALSHTLLDGNPAWPAQLADAARAGKLTHDRLVLMCPLALSRTQ